MNKIINLAEQSQEDQEFLAAAKKVKAL